MSAAIEAKEQAADTIMRRGPVIPVMIIDRREDAVPLARALLSGGITVLEITLRTDAAFEAIERILGEVEGAVTGVGTVLSGAQLERAQRLGCSFAVSPGAAPRLLDAADASPLPLLPGAATASEAMHLLERGYTRQKFFPAEQAGGVGYLKALASPLQAIRFCPTGGIDLEKARTYLALENVLCVGGSWVVPGDAIRAGDWPRITELAATAVRSLKAAG